ncbi:MAG: hypothetical protein M2R45_00889 [Verrucomicrobia subdivision 3 bacterium]|nr:hypothetical protein [Limisphaerales bacterium]MCS1414557.1 hypothetical protein [Limisphaerales bacterium]
MDQPLDIDFQNSVFLDEAIGWLGLGNLAEAEGQINRVAPQFVRHPDVLEVRWDISGRRREWDQALSIAERLVEGYPERCSGWLHRSYCLHELRRTLEAWNKLLPAYSKFPKEGTVPYNLACYSCQLGNLEQAKGWLEKAAKISGHQAIRSLAINDQDLIPLRDKLKTWLV